VIALAFWTRNPAPLLPYLDELDERGYHFYFGCSILGYPDEIESHNPGLQAAIRTFQKLSGRISPQRVRWRYDPILLSSATPEEYHLQRFEEIARALQGYTRHCILSFLEFYGKTGRSLGQVTRESGIRFSNPSLSEKQSLLRRLAGIAGSYGITLYSCCNDDLLVTGVRKNHCIDPELIGQFLTALQPLPPFKPTRRDCGCLESVDIGVYDTCLFGCRYCYATHARQAAWQRHAAHDPADTILWRPESLVGADLDSLAV
jgi:DNA repair photolyase